MATDEKVTRGSRPSAAVRQLIGGFRRQLLDNPVVRKELRGRMRGRRAFVVLTVHLLLLSCFTSLLYYAYSAASQEIYGPDSYLIGKILFGGVLGAQVLLVIFITPAFTAGTISSERERQTYDLLRTTLLSARTLVTGKLISALSYVVLLILAAVPLESLAFLLGGVALEEVIISQLILLVTALALGSASIYISSRMKSTLSATVVSYAFAFFLTAGLPMLLSILSPIIGLAGTFFVGAEEPHWLIVTVLIYVGGVLLAINPILTIILTEVVLISEQTVFFFKLSVPLTNAPFQDIWLVSPWLVYVLFYAALALVAYRLSVSRVRRREK